MRVFVSAFLDQAEQILEIASAQENGEEFAIVLDRAGAIRPERAGRSRLLQIESGAKAVFRVERRCGTTRVEGWDGMRRCLLQRQSTDYMIRGATGRSNPVNTIPSIGSSSSLACEKPSESKDMVTTSQSSETQWWLINRYSAPSSDPLIQGE